MGDNKVTDVKSARDWFNMNKKVVIEIKNNLLKYPNIKSISTHDDYFNNERLQYGVFSEKEKLYYKRVVFLSKQHGFSQVLVFREKGLSNGKLIGIRFILYSIGFVGKGKAICIEYIINNDGYIDILQSENNIFPLDENNWYIVLIGGK